MYNEIKVLTERMISMKITFMGAGSTVFCKNVLGDCMMTECMHDAEIALYDIDGERLEESRILIESLNKCLNQSRAKIKAYLGVENRKEALRGANFVVNAIQVGFYDPCTIIDFEIPKIYGLKQTIADTLGIGGIMRALRTIPVLKDFADDMQEVCPDAWFLNYTNPMAMLTGYMQRYTNVKTVGLCHSVQVCTQSLADTLGLDLADCRDKIAGINHMAWLLEIYDSKGNDMYPLIKSKIEEKLNDPECKNKVRLDYIKRFGYYCTESSEHNSEYNPFYIKRNYPDLIERYNIPIDEYPRRCVNQISKWKQQKEKLFNDGKIEHERSNEYASRIMEAIITNNPYKIGGNVINNGIIPNLPPKACVEVPCLVDSNGIQPTYVGELPVQLAAMNQTNINVQLMTIEAAVSRKREDIYMAAMFDPHTAAELSIDDIVSMCDELIAAHQEKGYMLEYK